MATTRSGLSRSQYFTIVEAGMGIWAAIASDPIETIGNSAIVDLGGRWLVVDTFMSARAATDLRAFVRRMAGNARVWVVNTHFHTDHCGGNEVFLNAATIAATAATRERIGQTATTLPERIAAAEVAAIELPPSDDAESVRRRRQAVARLDVLRRLRLVAPDVTISDRVTLYGQRRRADLITVGTAHTNGDIAIYLPDDRTLVAGDVVVNRTLPWVSDGDAPLWIEALGRLRTLKAAILIPGHGNVGDARTIDEMADCLGTLVANADALAGRNGPVAARPPERFRSWREAGRWAELVRAVATSKIQAPS